MVNKYKRNKTSLFSDTEKEKRERLKNIYRINAILMHKINGAKISSKKYGVYKEKRPIFSVCLNS